MTTPRDERVIEEFQRRRKRMLQSFGLCMLLIVASLLMMQLADGFESFLGVSSKNWYALAVAQFVAAVVFAISGFKQYRCPVCRQIVKGHDRYYFGVILDPRRCPNCGAHLRE